MPSLRDTVKSLALDAVKMNRVRLYDLYVHRDRFQVFIDRENPAAEAARPATNRSVAGLAEPHLIKTRDTAGSETKERDGQRTAKNVSQALQKRLFDKKKPPFTTKKPRPKEAGLTEQQEIKGAIRIEDCERVSRSLSFLIQTQIPDFFKKWNLEISSPGLERKLREKWHFKEALGREIKITAFSPGRGSCGQTGEEFQAFSFSGRLISCQEDPAEREDMITLKKNKTLWKIPYNQIKQARIVFLLLPHSSKTVKKAKYSALI